MPCRGARRPRASLLGSSSRTSCGRTVTGIVARTISRRSSMGRFGRSRPAAPLAWAGIGRRVITAARCGSPTTPVAIATVRSAKRSPRNGGSRPAAPTCGPSRIFTSSSPSRTRSMRWRKAIRAWSTRSSSAPPRTPCSPSDATRVTSAAPSASPRSCTRGDRICPNTSISMASSPAAHWRRTAHGGSPADRRSCFPCVRCPASFVRNTSTACAARLTAAT